MQLRLEYTDNKLWGALENYRNHSIQDSISFENTLKRMFDVLDRRIGKSPLTNMKESLEKEAEWLKLFYRLRLDSGIYKVTINPNLTETLNL